MRINSEKKEENKGKMWKEVMNSTVVTESSHDDDDEEEEEDEESKIETELPEIVKYQTPREKKP